MTTKRPTDPEGRTGRTKPWAIARMVHRAQPHLSEMRGWAISRFVVLAIGLLLVLMIGVAVYFSIGKTNDANPASNPGTPLPALATMPTPPNPSPTSIAPTPAPSPTESHSIIPSPSPVPTLTTIPTPRPTPTPIRYRVKVGDTLTMIAQRHGVTIKALMEANRLKSDVIRIGEELIIPMPRSQ